MIEVKSNCTGCGACIPVCPVQALRYSDDRRKVDVAASCIDCDLCLAACPIDAIGKMNTKPEVKRRAKTRTRI
ncbi:indolepyruvate ferredoxin oxidoreductase subunit alpha [Paenibacillus naphthalenovorans]|uniref:indolepyruvate ferredoxin oxidoreductase subunit alpha n=1 Tax=Paenibacillus naphthalenovorans TaxID=162209 RepID=UPI003D29586F